MLLNVQLQIRRAAPKQFVRSALHLFRINFLTGVTRELVILRSAAALLMLLAALRIRVQLVCIHHSFHVTPHMVI
jgi:hypothetical protein